MKIIKYEKKKNGKYKILLEDNNSIDTYEDVILKNNILYKKELEEDSYNNIINDNKYEEAYIKCVKYIGIRLRSKYEIKKYLIKYKYEDDIINTTIDKLLKNQLLDDKRFAIAFTKDKFRFSTSGPYKIKQELANQKIDNCYIEDALNSISEEEINEKIDKIILKSLNTNKPKDLILKNKIFTKLISLGYPKDLIINNLNKYIT